MPGDLNNAAPSGVLPQTLCTAFTESRQYPILSTQYHDGTVERGIITDTVNAPVSIRTWKQSKRLDATQMNALLAFFEQQNGGLTPFYFYDPIEGSPVGSNYDPTGGSTNGRYICVFRGDWMHNVDIARSTASIEFAEVQ